MGDRPSNVFLSFSILLTLFVGTPFFVLAQTPPRVGILVPEMERAQSQALRGLSEGLKGLGYHERKNVFFETRNVKGNRTALQPAAAALLARNVNVIFTTGTSATRAALAADPVYELMGRRGLAQTGMKDRKELGEIEFFIQALQLISFDPYGQGRLPVNESLDAASYYGLARPVGNPTTGLPQLLHYRWRDVYPSLQRLAPALNDPHDGVMLEYVNPATGGSTLPTMSCRIQMLRPNEHTKTHRHTSTSIYHAFRGSGTTVINGESFHWQKGDRFIVPLWSWHQHVNASSTAEAILFSMHDEPILRAFGLYKEEKRTL